VRLAIALLLIWAVCALPPTGAAARATASAVLGAAGSRPTQLAELRTAPPRPALLPQASVWWQRDTAARARRALGLQ
jgi:hypothetical protein